MEKLPCLSMSPQLFWATPKLWNPDQNIWKWKSFDYLSKPRYILDVQKSRATVTDIKRYYTPCANWAGWNAKTKILLPNGADCSHTNPGILTAGSGGGLNLGDRGHHQGIVRVLVLRSVPFYLESTQDSNFGLGIKI